MRHAGAHGAQPAIHSPTPRLQQATNLRRGIFFFDTWDLSCDSDRLGPWTCVGQNLKISTALQYLGPMWKVRNFDLKALGIP